jgi:hypothetical protein
MGEVSKRGKAAREDERGLKSGCPRPSLALTLQGDVHGTGK